MGKTRLLRSHEQEPSGIDVGTTVLALIQLGYGKPIAERAVLALQEDGARDRSGFEEGIEEAFAIIRP